MKTNRSGSICSLSYCRPHFMQRCRTLFTRARLTPPLSSFHSTPFVSERKSKKFDPFATLGVLETATDEEIRKEYRNLAKKYHPDVSKHPNAQQKFLDIQKAYQMIKDNDSREKASINDKYGDVFEGVDLDQLADDERELIVNVLEKIGKNNTILGGLYPSMVSFHVSSLRNKEIDYLFTASNVNVKLPHYVALTCDEHWSEEENTLIFHVFSRLEDQNAIGTIKYFMKNKKMEMMSRDSKLLATATHFSTEKNNWTTTEMYMVKSRGRTIGTISNATSNFLPFPIWSSLSILLKNESLPPLVGNRFCFLGTNLMWKAEKKVVASASRGFYAPFGRIFDIDISSDHAQVNPIPYLFSVVQSHTEDRKMSLFYSFFTKRLVGMLKGFITEKQKSKE